VKLLIINFEIKEKGLWRLEGKEYVVKEGDIMVFKFNV
jgi:ribosome-binding ATPase YchF (GTP1/OBG family)|tara:strand:+ start:1664 stop:1777 length:114 start_codon:yes stop_codon:yes gene_type:complete